MQRTLQVVLLGTNASVLAAFGRHHQYLIRHLEGDESRLSFESEQQPDLVVVIVGDDLHLCQQARQVWPAVPLMLVSENTSEYQMTCALDLGADAYVTIPFGEEEFLARVRALVRRMSPLHSGEVPPAPALLSSQDGRMILHLDTHRCLLAGQQVRLTTTEFELLRVLMEHREKVLTHRFLLQHVWGPAYSQESNYVRVYICQLRHKLETDPAHPRYLVTESGVGYVFRDPPAEEDTSKQQREEDEGQPSP